MCKARGGKVTKAMKEAAALRDNKFNSLQGCEVKLKIKDEFPIPQDDGYAALRALNYSLLSWRRKLEMLNKTTSTGQRYDVATSIVPTQGWATKES